MISLPYNGVLLFLAAVFLALTAAIGIAAADSGGKSLYMHWCAQCHGVDGKGDGVNSTLDMSINPRDHTDPNFMSTRTDEQFEDVIRGGGTKAAKSPIMPAFGKTLDDAQIKSLVKYLREICKCEFEGLLSNKKLRRVDTKFR